MRKITIPLILCAMLFGTVHSFAQVSLGIKGSFNMYNLALQDSDGKKIDTKMIPAFDAGFFAELPLADEFCFRPELLFAAKGAKSKNNTPEYTYNLSYLVLPLNFLYKGDLSGGKVLLGIGPYVAMGVGGKVKQGSQSIDIKFKNDVKLSEYMNAFYFKPIDYGANMMAGYEFDNGFSFALNASLGLSNIDTKIEGKQPDTSTKNVGFGITLGYRLMR